MTKKETDLAENVSKSSDSKVPQINTQPVQVDENDPVVSEELFNKVNTDNEPIDHQKKTSSIEKDSHLRLHPISSLFIIFSFIKSFFIPILITFFFGAKDTYQTVFMFLVIPGILFAIAQYWVYRYQLLDNEIVIREGVFIKSVRHVPYNRIQNLNLIRGPFHRLLGVAQVELESASGGKPEAVMSVLSLEKVQQLKEILLNEREATNAECKGESLDEGSIEQSIESFSEDDIKERNGNDSSKLSSKSLLKLPIVELVKVGVISNKGMVVVAAAIGLFYQFSPIEDAVVAQVKILKDEFDWVGTAKDNTWIMGSLFFLGGVLFLFLLRVLSIAMSIVTYYGFNLTIIKNKLVAEYGLLTQINATLPQVKIQQVTVRETLLHRWFLRQAIRVETAGGGRVQNDASSGTQLKWVAPIIKTADVNDFLLSVLPDTDLEVFEWHYAAFRAWKRVFRKWGILITLSCFLLSYFYSLFALSGLIVIVPAIYYAKRYVSSVRFGVTSNAIVFESGWLFRHKTVVPFNKVQSIRLSKSPFDQYGRMASILVDIAGLDAFQHHIDIPFVEIDLAQTIKQDWFTAVCETEFRWR